MSDPGTGNDSEKCTAPDECEWHLHEGGRMPTGPKMKVIVRYRCGSISTEIEAGQRRWESWRADIGESAWDIVAWRKVQPGNEGGPDDIQL